VACTLLRCGSLKLRREWYNRPLDDSEHTTFEKIPLISHAKNHNIPITSSRPIRQLVQTCFDRAAEQLENIDQVVFMRHFNFLTGLILGLYHMHQS